MELHNLGFESSAGQEDSHSERNYTFSSAMYTNLEEINTSQNAISQMETHSVKGLNWRFTFGPAGPIAPRCYSGNELGFSKPGASSFSRWASQFESLLNGWLPESWKLHADTHVSSVDILTSSIHRRRWCVTLWFLHSWIKPGGRTTKWAARSRWPGSERYTPRETRTSPSTNRRRSKRRESWLSRRRRRSATCFLSSWFSSSFDHSGAPRRYSRTLAFHRLHFIVIILKIYSVQNRLITVPISNFLLNISYFLHW